jgi:hypothetical protein
MSASMCSRVGVHNTYHTSLLPTLSEVGMSSLMITLVPASASSLEGALFFDKYLCMGGGTRQLVY